MKLIKSYYSVMGITFFLSTILGVIFLTDMTVFGHGPKGHGDNVFTPLNAVKKSITLYDRLLSNGKLDESWEAGLRDIIISTREQNNKTDIVVQFNRKDGDPRSVFIFFDKNGKYTGSNFNGN